MKTRKSLILLSGGLDSSYNLAVASKNKELKLAITIDYGQKSASKEIEASIKLSRAYKIPHRIINIPWLKEISKSSLTQLKKKIPSPDISNFQETKKSAKNVWVPNRNGLFINIAAPYAEALKIDEIIVGFNKEEAGTFPDNSLRFLDAINNSLRFSTIKKIRVKSYTKNFVKKQIVKKAIEIGLPLDLIWPCYGGGDCICKKCESCKRFLAALSLNGL